MAVLGVAAAFVYRRRLCCAGEAPHPASLSLSEAKAARTDAPSVSGSTVPASQAKQPEAHKGAGDAEEATDPVSELRQALEEMGELQQVRSCQ